MCKGPGQTAARSSWPLPCSVTVLIGALCACDPGFDTSWRKPPPGTGDAGVDSGDLDAEPPPHDATLPPDGQGGDSSFPPLPSIDCAAVVRDASVDASCEVDCFAACSFWCGQPGTSCGDAETRMPCWQCRDGGIPPTL